MGRQLVSSGGPWEAKVGYSRAVRAGDWVFVSGTTAMKDGQLVGEGDPVAQTRQALVTIGWALEQCGATFADVIRYRVYVTRVDDWQAIAPELAAIFSEIRPANTLVEVSALIDPRMLVEIEVDALIVSAAR